MRVGGHVIDSIDAKRVCRECETRVRIVEYRYSSEDRVLVARYAVAIAAGSGCIEIRGTLLVELDREPRRASEIDEVASSLQRAVLYEVAPLIVMIEREMGLPIAVPSSGRTIPLHI